MNTKNNIHIVSLFRNTLGAFVELFISLHEIKTAFLHITLTATINILL